MLFTSITFLQASQALTEKEQDGLQHLFHKVLKKGLKFVPYAP